MATVEQHTSAGHLTGYDTCGDTRAAKCFAQSLTGKGNDRMYLTLHVPVHYCIFRLQMTRLV